MSAAPYTVQKWTPKLVTGKPPAHDPQWASKLLVDERGNALANLANVMTALRSAPELAEVLAFDEMAGEPVLVGEIPGTNPSESEATDQPRPIRDADVSALQEWLQRAKIARLSKEVCHQAVDLRASERAFHPVRRYLESTTWDGTPRASEWLSSYLGVENTPYTSAVGRMFLVSLIARVMDPGCKADCMLILEGEQGARKSTACSILGGQWFSDNMPDVTSGKEVSQHLQGKWLLEIGELSAMSRAESAHLKAFITRPVERYRPPYGRRDVIQPRQCVFVGTTNQAAYLKDETGGRRFWPVKVGVIDTLALTRDRDQILAEALRLYRDGVKWWANSDFERLHIRPQQEARQEVDAWQEVVEPWLGHRSRVSVTEVARDCLSLEAARLGTTEQRRIGAILTKLAWKPVRDHKGRGYIRP